MDVTVPDGVGPGDIISFQTPSGEWMEVAVPDGVQAGEDFTVDLGEPAAPEPTEPAAPESPSADEEARVEPRRCHASPSKVAVRATHVTARARHSCRTAGSPAGVAMPSVAAAAAMRRVRLRRQSGAPAQSADRRPRRGVRPRSSLGSARPRPRPLSSAPRRAHRRTRRRTRRQRVGPSPRCCFGGPLRREEVDLEAMVRLRMSLIRRNSIDAEFLIDRPLIVLIGLCRCLETVLLLRIEAPETCRS